MKQTTLILCILLLGGGACTSDGNSASQQEEQTTAPAGVSGEAAIDLATAPRTGVSGSFLPPSPSEEHPLLFALTKDFWVFEYYIGDENADRLANKGRWFRFFPDGTFESGVWQEEAGYGSWKLRDEQGKTMLYLDNINDALDAKWEIQGVNKDQDTMTWSGVKDTSVQGAITKVINLLTKPTKAQFGVEE